MAKLWQQFQREVKANGKKAGLLAGLFLFGCCFWVPMLLSAVSPRHPAVAKPSAVVPSPAVTAATPQGAAVPATEMNSSEFWKDLSQALAEDPMFQSADVRSLERDPFQLTEIPEPLPILFAEEPRPPVVAPKKEAESEPLLLSSTIISRSRRAALINGQLYQLGRRIQANGRDYQLTQIESNRVVLSAGEQTIELTLVRPQLKDVLDRTRATGPVQ